MSYISISDAEFITKTFRNGDSIVITIPKIWVETLKISEHQVIRVNIKVLEVLEK